MQAEWHNFTTNLSQPSLGRPDRAVELTNEARAFRQIRHWIEHEGLELESELLRVLPVPPRLTGKLARRFKLVAARALAFLTHGMVPLNWRQATRPATRLVPVFYERNLDCFFMKFECHSRDDTESELAIHVMTLLDARDSLVDWAEEDEHSHSMDAVDYLLKAGLLAWSKLLPDNSRSSWESYEAKTPLVPNFAFLQQRLIATEK